MFKSLKLTQFEWALAATAFYCGAVFSGVHENWTTFLGLRPNEVGDFLAGVFGPLAFLWLVFGYYQQGEELKHSVEALKLQAEELNESVQQQKLANEISRENIELSNREKVLSMRPKIMASFHMGTQMGDGMAKYKLTAKNLGPVATNVSILAKIASQDIEILGLTTRHMSSTDPDLENRSDWRKIFYDPVVIEAEFSDADGREYSEHHIFEFEQKSRNFVKRN